MYKQIIIQIQLNQKKVSNKQDLNIIKAIEMLNNRNNLLKLDLNLLQPLT